MPSGVYTRTSIHRRNMSLSKLGDRNPMKRDEVIEKNRQSKKKYYENHPQIKEKIGLSKLGKNSNLWKGGKSSDDEILRARIQSKTWRQQVKERDNYTCQHCGKSLKITPRDCHAHHIKSWSEYPELRYDVNNGITLCRSCHNKEH